MPHNLELKIKVESHAKLIKLLKGMNAKRMGVLNQRDIYYEVKKGLLKLRVENGSSTLIKYLRDEKGKRWSNYELLTLTGRNPEKYLSEILKVTTVVEKRRELFLYDNTRIHLDQVRNLGRFLELETLLIDDRRDAQKRFNKVVRMLELDLSSQIRSSYKTLLSEK